MPWVLPAIAIAGTVASTAMTAKGQADAGAAASSAANSSKKAALLDNEKYMANAVMATFEAERIKDNTKLDTDYLDFATKRQVDWLGAIGAYDVNLTKTKAASQFINQADEALARAGDIKEIAELQAAYMEGEGARRFRQKVTETNFKRVMQDEENAQKLGLLRATAGARMVAYSGSSLDVLAHEEAMARARQAAIVILGGMQADDVQYDANAQANITRQKASIQAQALERQYTDNPLDDPVLQASIAKMQVGTQRDIVLTSEEGWRTIMKMKRDAATGVNKATIAADEQMVRAVGSSGAASSYGAAADSAFTSGITKAGTSVLTGASDAFKIWKDSSAGKKTLLDTGTPGSSGVWDAPWTSGDHAEAAGYGY